VTNLAPELWREIKLYLAKCGKYKSFVNSNGQEDTHESFIMLMECFEEFNEITNLFIHKISTIIFCDKCNHKISKLEKNTYMEIPPLLRSSQHADLEDLLKKIDPDKLEKGTLNDYILKQITYVEGFTCQNPECDEPYARKLKISQLSQIPEILYLVIAKYDSKYMTPLPDILYIPTKAEKMGKTKVSYLPVAQIEHYGGQEGGHYTARAIRICQSDEKEGYANANANANANAIDWFSFNDSQFNLSHNFKPSENTYVVIYHLSDL
jgi:hypothetical protein